MRKVGKAAAVALMTPLTVAAIAVGASGSAEAESGCWLFAHAAIAPPSGSIAAGSKVHVSASVSGMLAKAHLQISGPGLSKQVGPSISDGVISGDVTISEPGYYTLSVIGNLTSCTYDTSGFPVKPRSVGSKPTPTHQKTPSKSPRSGGYPLPPGSAPPLPGGSGSGAGTGGIPTMQPPGSNPFSLPSVGPDGSGIGFQYPTPDPQIAAPAAKQDRASDVSASTPIKWGQSIAAALALLLLSAHFGMWSRRQRLAAEARTAQTGLGGRSSRPSGAGGKAPRGGGPTIGRRRRRPPVSESVSADTGASSLAEGGAATGTSTSGAAEADTATRPSVARAVEADGATGPSVSSAGEGDTATGPSVVASAAKGKAVPRGSAETASTASGGAAAEKPAPAADTKDASSAPRGYRGRRRRR
ncbi:MAG: hypothetical protein ACJ72W_11435 [Actinoallomurus sp.]